MIGSSLRSKSELEQLYRSHRWFELRDSISRHPGNVFYVGAVAAVFNEVDECKRRLKSIIESSPASREAGEAHRLLVWTHARRGEFRSALSELQTLAALEENSAELLPGILLYAALARYPQQRVVERGLSLVTCKKQEGYLFVPIQVNGRPVHFMVDSGANISLMTESQARKLQLSREEVPSAATMMYGVTGTSSTFRTALVKELILGRHTIENVIFFVVSDHQFDFPPGFGGALGLPVLLALRTLRWTADGNFEAGFAPAVKRLSECNLAFDNSDCIVRAFSSGKGLDMLLDTGNNQTVLWPPFAAHFKPAIDTEVSSHLELAGVSGKARVEHHRISRFELKIGSFDLCAKDIPVFRQVTTPNSRWLSGHLGIDLLARSKKAILDFPAMQLSME